MQILFFEKIIEKKRISIHCEKKKIFLGISLFQIKISYNNIKKGNKLFKYNRFNCTGYVTFHFQCTDKLHIDR